MTRNARWSGMAAILLFTVNGIVCAGTSTWIVDANGSWGGDTNWDVAPAWDGSDHIVLGTDLTGHRTLTLDGTRSIQSLKAVGYRSYRLTPGQPGTSRLVVLTGRLETEASRAYSVPLDTRGIALQIGDGVTPVSDAAWSFNNSAATSPIEIGDLMGIPGTVVTMDGNNLVNFSGNNAESYLGEFLLSGTRVRVNGGSSALGGGIARIPGSPAFDGIQFAASTLNATDIVCEGLTKIAVDTDRTVEISGNLSGSGNLEYAMIGTASTVFRGTLILSGPDNTLGGSLTVKGGTVRMDGTFTDLGDISVYFLYGGTATLAGTGTVGLADGKKVTIQGRFHSSVANYKFLAPGTDGTVGTLTIGTPGNQNKVVFEEYSAFKCDLSGATAGSCDLLALSGALELNAAKADKELHLYLVDGAGLSGDYTLVTCDSLTGTFDRVYLDDVEVADPTSPNGVGGTHQLVYGATSLQLVAAPPGGTLILLR